jgi:hypothetical protein
MAARPVENLFNAWAISIGNQSDPAVDLPKPVERWKANRPCKLLMGATFAN